MPKKKKIEAYLGDGKYVFVSYAHKDEKIVYPFISSLLKKCNVWFDEGIHYAKEWDEEIVKKISNCTVFVFAITKNSLESENCKDEIAFAKDNKIPFINVLMEDIELPKEFKFRYGKYQMCKFFEFDDPDDAVKNLFRRSEEIKTTFKIGESSKAVVEETAGNEETQQNHETGNENYALFNFEKEITIFQIFGADKENTIENKEYFEDQGDLIYRIVLLPGESFASPVQGVELLSLELRDDRNRKIARFESKDGFDGCYSHNVLDRGYNCICANVKTDKDMCYLFEKVNKVIIREKIYSIFNVCLEVEHEITMNGKQNVENNPDLKEIPDLVTFKIHHCRFKVK